MGYMPPYVPPYGIWTDGIWPSRHPWVHLTIYMVSEIQAALERGSEKVVDSGVVSERISVRNWLIPVCFWRGF